MNQEPFAAGAATSALTRSATDVLLIEPPAA